MPEETLGEEMIREEKRGQEVQKTKDEMTKQENGMR